MLEHPLIAVTGATGGVGGRLTARLAEAGSRQRLVVRDLARAPRIAGAEIRQASGYGARDEMRVALEGADVLFLIPAAETPDRVQQHATAIDAAVAAGVRSIVYLSFFGAAPDATFTLARDHWHTEQHVRATGLPCTFLRMNVYMDFIPAMVSSDGVLRGPAGDGRLAAILRDDVAAAAAAVLTASSHNGRTYDLTGPDAFTLAEAAEVMSRATGKSIREVAYVRACGLQAAVADGPVRANPATDLPLGGAVGGTGGESLRVGLVMKADRPRRPIPSEVPGRPPRGAGPRSTDLTYGSGTAAKRRHARVGPHRSRHKARPPQVAVPKADR